MITFLPRRRRRRPLNLPLVAMIDIFALLVIFLVKGTVFGAADVSLEKVKLPTSISKESVESAPEVLISGKSVKISALQKKFPISLFRPDTSGSADALALKAQLTGFVAKLPPEARSSGVLLNVVADRNTPYQDIFDTVRLFRESGFQTLLFVATGASPLSGGAK